MRKALFIAVLMAASVAANAQKHISVDFSMEKFPVQKTMYGVFFEDINFAADGGLYAELVKNRSFEFDNPLQGWQSFGNVEVRNDGPFSNCPHYVHLSYAGHPVRVTGLENEGFFGMGIEEGKQYMFSVWARCAGKAAKEYVSFHLCEDNTQADDQRFFSEAIEITSKKWQKYEIVFTAPKTSPKATLRVLLETWEEGDSWNENAAVDLEHISLFPVETFMGRENGLRKDVAQAIADLKPGVFRFPGGCIVEGTDLENRYQWKHSVEQVENRPINVNRWMYDQSNRFFGDYYQSYGLGFYEYFQFAEDIGAEALPVISCGMACQFENDPEMHPHADLKDLQSYIDDALDLIEFANGPAKSKWGKVRAGLGHPEPFNLHYIAVGNEQWGEDFITHLEPFVKAIRAKYPDIKIIGSSGPYASGEWFDDLWPEMKRLGADLVDEHFYSNENFFERNADRYDNYDRSSKTKVFAGEYACHGTSGHKFNHFNAAIVEAAFMTGLERNADVVYMATYAPLLAHVDGWQWRPDLIWFDNLNTMKTCSYYVQQLYSLYKGTDVLDVTMDGKPVAGKEGQNSLYATAVKDSETGEYYVKVVNLSNYAQTVYIDLRNLPEGISSCEMITLHSDNAMADNIFTPDAVVPQTSSIDLTPVEHPEYYWEMGMRKLEDGTPSLMESISGRTFAIYKFK
ncbi:MAG: carbohydrate binding domain-containing protein [Bacteroidales bacterium]|nr:carbohydrate binding domain-containing protein [Bacteroidales bacterium]